jgi:transposase InsO family protein
VIVCTDYATRYAIVKAVGKATAEAVADFLIQEVYLKFGSPKTIVSDRGTHFMSYLAKELYKFFGTKHTPTTAYNPQCNGLTERLNRTLANSVAKCIDEKPLAWDQAIPFVVFAYNTTPQESTGYSPYLLVFGREPQMDLDRQYGIDEMNQPYNQRIAENIDWIRD